MKKGWLYKLMSVFCVALLIAQTQRYLFWYFSDCHTLKIAKHCEEVIDTESAVNLMINAETDTINHDRINGVKCNCLFLCKAETDTERLDLRRDSMGVWVEGHRTAKIPFKGSARSDIASSDSLVWRLVYKCKSHPQLKRTEIYRKKKLEDGTTGGLISPVLIQYHFDGKPQAIDVLPHGNSKNSIPFHPSDKSLLEKVHQQTSDSSVSAQRLYNKVRILIIRL